MIDVQCMPALLFAQQSSGDIPDVAMNTDVGPCVAEPCQGSYNVECTDTSDFQLLLHALPVDDLRRLFGPLCTFENWDELVVSHVHFVPGPSGDDIVFQAKELSGLSQLFCEPPEPTYLWELLWNHP